MQGVQTTQTAPAALPFVHERSVAGGIERSVVRPRDKRHATPLLFAHGMWHGAWCWRPWQELFAMWGWESVAFSLPGHGESPMQRPIRWCTLGYYTSFLKAEIERFETPPVLVGHSLGTALGLRYMKEQGASLPAMVMLAPWLNRSMIGLVGRYFGIDLTGALATLLTLTAAPCVRSAQSAARIFLGKESTCTPEELHAGLCAESMFLPLQHNPPFWTPPASVDAPMLWISAENDALIPEDASRASAAELGADYLVAGDAGHDLMMAPDHALTAALIDDWLKSKLGDSEAQVAVA